MIIPTNATNEQFPLTHRIDVLSHITERECEAIINRFAFSDHIHLTRRAIRKAGGGKTLFFFSLQKEEYLNEIRQELRNNRGLPITINEL
ncbi:MAG: hypothetical protein HUK20_13230 [Fibrobacter sp.]|nr:hypothetical protein [Fibrobacter sp.]